VGKKQRCDGSALVSTLSLLGVMLMMSAHQQEHSKLQSVAVVDKLEMQVPQSLCSSSATLRDKGKGRLNP